MRVWNCRVPHPYGFYKGEGLDSRASKTKRGVPVGFSEHLTSKPAPLNFIRVRHPGWLEPNSSGKQSTSFQFRSCSLQEFHEAFNGCRLTINKVRKSLARRVR